MKEIGLIDPQQIEATKPGYANLQDQLEFGRFNSVKSGAAPTLYHEFYAVEGQQEFSLPQGTYTMGDHSLQVYANGQLMTDGVDGDYVEVDSSTIRFNFGLVNEDKVVFRVNGGTSGPALHESFIAEDGQIIFDLTGSYTVGNHSLIVYVSGAYQTVDVDYEEANPKRIVFLTPLEDGDLVTFRVDGLPSIQSKYLNTNIVNTYDNAGRITRRETTGDAHIVEEYEYDADGLPSRLITRESGFIVTKTYTWVSGRLAEVVQQVREGT